jgi:hypothetical protein
MAAPPFSGTIFIDPDILTDDDPTCFETLIESGRGERQMFDRRTNGWVTHNVFLFTATYDDGKSIEIQVNPEFKDSAAAGAEAARFAPVIGRLPAALRRDVRTVWIHKGNNPFGGGNNNLLIHTEQADRYIADGILEETFIHEACHTSLDADHARAPGWVAAQQADPEFISTYARDNPQREDIAESFLPWVAVRHRTDRIPDSLMTTITGAIPARLQFFDDQNFDLYPMVQEKEMTIREFSLDAESSTLELNWASLPAMKYQLQFSTDLITWKEVGEPVPSGGPRTTHAARHVPGGNQAFYRIIRFESP